MNFYAISKTDWNVEQGDIVRSYILLMHITRFTEDEFYALCRKHGYYSYPTGYTRRRETNELAHELVREEGFVLVPVYEM